MYKFKEKKSQPNEKLKYEDRVVKVCFTKQCLFESLKATCKRR